MKIEEYYIAYGKADFIVKEINQQLKLGYEIYGQPFVFNDFINQAMVKYEEGKFNDRL